MTTVVLTTEVPLTERLKALCTCCSIKLFTKEYLHTGKDARVLHKEPY